MKKLLQINSVINTGSTGRIAEEIGKLAASRGWESHIAYGRYGNPSSSNLMKVGSISDTYWHVFKTRVFDMHGFGSKQATINLVNKIENINPDIIHLHNIHGYYIHIKILFEYLAINSIPVVWTLHDCWSFTGHCVHFESIGCDKWKELCSNCPQLGSYPKSILFDNSQFNYEQKKILFNSLTNLTIVPVSYWLKNLVESSFLKNNSLQTIQNGIDLSIFKPKSNKNFENQYHIIKNKFVILGVANIWAGSKGYKDFLELSNIIDNKTLIILVGLTQKQIKHLPSNILGIEKTENIEQLALFYSIANVFLNLTYEDTFPTTNLEALGCGTPIITYNTGGSPEAISIDTGFVVEQGNIKDLLRCIQQVQKQSKEHFTEACRARAKNYFNKNKKFNEYLDLYNELLRSKEL